MRIRQLQQQIVEGLNGVETLVQHRCKAFAEDALTVQNAVGNAVTGAGEIAIVVVTPRGERDGDGCEAGVPVSLHVALRCIESPALRGRRDGFTALDAAEEAIHALDGNVLAFASIEQTADARTGTVTVSANFEISVILTNE